MAKPSNKDDTLLARWLSGELSAEEEAQLRQQPEFKDYERLVGKVDRMRPPVYDADGAFAALQEARTAPKSTTRHLRARPRRNLRIWYGAAAAIALLLTAWFLLRPTNESFTTATGADLLAKNLSDGSTIRMNDQTSLEFFPSDTTRQARLAGEAFFQVQKSSVPFTVATSLGQVTVVGTEFNVYSRADSMAVFCTEGRVRVQFSGKSDSHDLTPGLGVSLNAAGQVNELSEAKESTDWLSDTSVFINRPLQEILDELERQYAVTIERPASMDLRKKYNTDWPHDDLDLALERSLSPAGMDFDIVGKVVTPRPK
ncbi:MAG: FecR domain-containing protein [Bacteroidota bacterium]